ncbi:MAG: putative integrase [Prokaryotic dsDNA virus sp.]|jgi:integrase|nr:MAG: putative integrase [Prokaryotic dsDNA virus sp.]|tara:strand:+ start:249 stop:1343 length:1095 start_codon:yes stop_codon:yes gene_type:complete
MKIRKRGNSWQADARVGGKRVRKLFRSLADAEDFLHNLEHRSKLGLKVTHILNTKSAILTLKRLTDTVYEAVWKDTANGINALRNVELIQKIVGSNIRVEEINTTVIDKIIQTLKSQGNSNGTINNKMSALMVCLKYAHDRDWIQNLPKFKRYKVSEGRLRYFSLEEEEMIISTHKRLGQHDFAGFVKILIDTGLRTGELCRVRYKDVVKESGRWKMYVWARGHDYRTKNGEMRIVPLSDEVVEIITDRWDGLDTNSSHPKIDNNITSITYRNSKVFDYTKSNIRTQWNNVRDILGYMKDEEFVPHLCRHTCATRLVQAGVPLLAVKDWMGHKSIQVTMRYAKLAPNAVFDALDTLTKKRKTNA